MKCMRVVRSLRMVVSAIALWAFFLMTVSLSGAEISYVYDNLGRLSAVIDPATDTAVYSYDAVGNLTGITRQTSSTLAVFQFTPSGGPVGTAVTIYGTGFSATPASNTVQFNGTTATVLTASTTVLTTTVPIGTTTGPISVTVGGNTATSVASFTVGTGPAPTISTFTPTIGALGTSVSVTGTNFDTAAERNRVTFGGLYASVTNATATSLTANAPAAGHITVATAAGRPRAPRISICCRQGLPPPWWTLPAVSWQAAAR